MRNKPVELHAIPLAVNKRAPSAMKNMYKFIFKVGLFMLWYSLPAQMVQVSGMVFEDSNANGKRDKNEDGIPGVVVSDQQQTAITAEDGNYTLVTDGRFPHVFISMPARYSGTYYYPLAERVDFPLAQSAVGDRFSFIHASDTHIDSLNLPRMERFRKMADSLNADFVIISGDLIRDALRVSEPTARDYYELYLSEIRKFKMPVFSAVGNHELFGIERDKSLVSQEHPLYGKNMFRHYLGPNYYSFNFGGLHFVGIDGVQYQNLYYYGGVDSLQLQWLEKDLKTVPESTPVITFNHIPFVSPGFSFMDFENDPYYGPQLLTQAKLLEHRHIVYNFEEVLELIGDRPYPLALSGHFHMAQQAVLQGSGTIFAQTAAISRPDTFDYNGFKGRSGFTLYEVAGGKIHSSTFIALNFP